MSKELIELLKMLQEASEKKRSKSDIPVVSERINWGYLIDAVIELYEERPDEELDIIELNGKKYREIKEEL